MPLPSAVQTSLSASRRITRKVGKDSSISIDKVSYGVPIEFISSKVESRFLPDDMSSAFILYE
jgi:hypothetical protein|nr:Mu transposase C-terminal domain-containing protein [uncultured Acetatifactor sp.]